VNSILGIRLFRGDKLDMIDKDTLNFESTTRGHNVNVIASLLGTAKGN